LFDSSISSSNLTFYSKINLTNMKSKEELMLMWLIVGTAGLILTITYPPIILLGVVGYASWSLWKHYTI